MLDYIKGLLTLAKEKCTGNWAQLFFAILIILIPSMLYSITNIFGVLIFLGLGPLSLGLSQYMLRFVRNEEVNLNMIFEGFNDWKRAIPVYLMIIAATVLGFILFIIPGVIVTIALSQSFYLMADDKESSPVDILKKSRELMRDHMWRYFFLSLAFIPLALIGVLTLGIGFFWILPLITVTSALFHQSITRELNPDDFVSAQPIPHEDLRPTNEDDLL